MVKITNFMLCTCYCNLKKKTNNHNPSVLFLSSVVLQVLSKAMQKRNKTVAMSRFVYDLFMQKVQKDLRTSIRITTDFGILLKQRSVYKNQMNFYIDY